MVISLQGASRHYSHCFPSGFLQVWGTSGFHRGIHSSTTSTESWGDRLNLKIGLSCNFLPALVYSRLLSRLCMFSATPASPLVDFVLLEALMSHSSWQRQCVNQGGFLSVSLHSILWDSVAVFAMVGESFISAYHAPCGLFSLLECVPLQSSIVYVVKYYIMVSAHELTLCWEQKIHLCRLFMASVWNVSWRYGGAWKLGRRM